MGKDETRNRRYGTVIIGAGQGGKPLAVALANAGQKVALVERELVGGTCINVGCTPTKTMVASARVAYLARRGIEYGVHTSGPIDVDMIRVRERKRSIVESFRGGSERQIEMTRNLELVRGEASFEGPRSIRVVSSGAVAATLKADCVVIDTGTRSSTPPVEGLGDIPYLDSTSIMELDHVPRHLIVLGGGYIGVEFGQMFRRFGSEVTIIHRGKQLLSREDEDVARGVADVLRDDGITVMLDSPPVRVKESGKEAVSVWVSSGGEERAVNGSHVLVATGRIPNTDALRPAAGGVETDDRGFIRVNSLLETSADGVFAIGDVKGGPAFTHISYDDFRVLQHRFLNGSRKTTEGRIVPYTVFIDPQLGRVGLSEAEARAAGIPYRIASMPMEHVARALEMDETRGFMKVLVDGESDQILGCAVLGIEGGEIMAMIQIAMMGKIPYTRLRDAVFAHPTLAESLNNLFADLRSP
ncbi:MAG: mercuric reductase [Ignavibacteria bacterium]|nr:mercuric reductase [Ignavibacteria bacterium]